jgi:membrane fusion protein (multidrug efflux system)
MRPLRTLVACATVAALGCAGLSACKPSAAPAPAAQPAPQVTVITVQPRRVAIKTELPGRTSPTLIAEVRPQVTGLVQSRNFREGSEVKAGAVLYRLDPATYQAAYDSAVAAVAKAEASLQTARLKATRLKELVAIKFVSQQEYDEAAAAVRQGEADLAAARAAAETARINLGYTRVTAPISGRVGKSAVTAGALVTANQSAPLATIQQLDPVYVDVTQSSAELLRLRRALESGQLRRAPAGAASVALLLEDGSAYPHEGALQFSDVTVDPATGAITLRALFPNSRRLLLPGMYVRAVIEEGVRENAIVVPQQAVTRDAKGEAVAMVVGADDKVESRKLQVARTLGSDWIVDAGLQAGDRVIVEGLQRARAGVVVQAVERSDAAASAEAAPAATPSAAPLSQDGKGQKAGPESKAGKAPQS